MLGRASSGQIVESLGWSQTCNCDGRELQKKAEASKSAENRLDATGKPCSHTPRFVAAIEK